MNDDKVNELLCIGYNNNNNYSVVSSSDNCVVVESNGYIYKILQLPQKDPKVTYENIVRRAFASEYRKLGISWNVREVQSAGEFYRIEKHEKLRVVKPSEINIEELIKSFSKIKTMIEKSLEFPRLLVQVKKNEAFSHISKIVLARECVDSYTDYAWADNVPVHLGNTKWFLALLDYSGRWVDDINNEAVPVSLDCGNFYFARYNTYNKWTNAKVIKNVNNLYDTSPKWWLYERSLSDVAVDKVMLKSNLDEMLRTNEKILTSKRSCSVKTEYDFGIREDLE